MPQTALRALTIDPRCYDAVIFDLDGVPVFDSTIALVQVEPRSQRTRPRRRHRRGLQRVAVLPGEWRRRLSRLLRSGVIDIECRGQVQRLTPGRTVEFS